MPVFPPIINNNISNIRDTLHITLTAAGWANNQQVIPCNPVGSNSTVMPNPTAASKDAYINAGIELTEATAESLTFTCSTVPTEDIAVLVHIIDPLITAESTEILTFDSVDEMNAYEAEEGAIAMVPSEGDDGLEVVELTTTVSPNTNSYFNEAESAALASAWQKGKPIIIKCPFNAGTLVVDDFSVVAMCGLAKMEGAEIPMFAISFGSKVIQFADGAVFAYNGWTTSTNTV